jgi:hypothetical protein
VRIRKISADSPSRLSPGRVSAGNEPGSGPDPVRRRVVGRQAYERILREWTLSIRKIGR